MNCPSPTKQSKPTGNTMFPQLPLLILFYYFPLVRNKTVSNGFWKVASALAFPSLAFEGGAGQGKNSFGHTLGGKKESPRRCN